MHRLGSSRIDGRLRRGSHGRRAVDQLFRRHDEAADADVFLDEHAGEKGRAEQQAESEEWGGSCSPHVAQACQRQRSFVSR